MTHATNEEEIPEFKVVTNNDRQQILFRGREEDARAHIENNYPRVHVEPGRAYGDEGPQPDVVMHDADGNVHRFVGGEWHSDSDDTASDDEEVVSEDEV